MLTAAAAQRGAFAAAYADDAPRQQLLLALLGHVDAGARQAAAQLLGLLVPHLGEGPGSAVSAAEGGPGAQPAPPPQPRVAALCDALLSTLRVGSAEGAKHAKAEQLDGAAAAAGYVAAHLIQSWCWGAAGALAAILNLARAGAAPCGRFCWQSACLACCHRCSATSHLGLPPTSVRCLAPCRSCCPSRRHATRPPGAPAGPAEPAAAAAGGSGGCRPGGCLCHRRQRRAARGGRPRAGPCCAAAGGASLPDGAAGASSAAWGGCQREGGGRAAAG